PGTGKTSHFSPGGRGPGGFHFSNTDDIFAQFMRSSDGGNGGAGTNPFWPKADAPSPEVTIVEKPLLVSLEELFEGTTKRMKINRKTYDRLTGTTSTQDRILEIPIKKGLGVGSKIKFADVEQTAEGSQDLHFIVTDKPHATFKRSGNDLHQIVEISLMESLIGWERSVPLIDGKRYQMSINGPTGPTWTHQYPGEGMPLSKKPTERGNMVVEISIKYPPSLTTDQKKVLKIVL
ncbi:HSP40/DnaJ peptide-binding protein, partial [Setomelanomma holmii]